jgi:hypothetical protein
LNYTSQTFDFFTYQVPSDPRLPGGGGYLVRGLANPKPALATGQPSAVTIAEELEYTWSGVDTNFVWRAPGGLRVNGGTSTGRALRDTCYAEFEVAFPGSSIRGPNVKSRDGNTPACNPKTRFDTTVRGSAAYTIPKIDLLVSSVFQYRPGVELNANLVVGKDQVQWESDSAYRASQPCTGANAGQVGCFVAVGNATTATTTSINLLDPGDLYSEAYTIFDLKLSNIRFGGRRLNLGVDIYNLFNDDAIRGINQTYTIDNPATPAIEVNNWGNPTTLLSPRFARLQVQFDF